ncbi:anthranilate phosphoribosyltransferase [Lysinibacillus sp. RSDA_15]|uniref:anthranilate phosphoribosyltransferase n=1 Tax=Lysinibacillus TaxID=400634 RepID=UPI00055E5C3F|nr:MULTISPECIES: anthranilate phosphoribosyltransferase [Lysinibacillus]MBG9694007.1 anthranilate phosphoribosyltransferase [Lysinibacillus sphaericus]MBG9756508.1 anthranilate phosphoribosyltransferase [Lysinibacillus sphaericus]MBI6862383.1 anthranilate phosphoribosyltransferase [Lysinibacillus fusiformis]MEB7453901.1 anthranilate phosphoribosyltransferase [Lysinibacillus sphaericus]PIJ97278.1 anthranilate phosphoribosyltransferase [Lysinibacillus sphaericus]
MKHLQRKVLQGQHLMYEEMLEVAQWLFQDDTPKDEIASFLTALSIKGETAHEVAALATIMRSFASNVPVKEGRYMDNCGTGGDGLHTFNISTASAFVLAGAGVKIAKHGNRKISSSSGSSDVLEALGIHTEMTIPQTVELLEKEGVSFLYAPNVHPKLRRIGEVRRSLGRPTIFNLVGPLTNPVALSTQFTGINRPQFVMEYASVLQMLGRERAIVVSGPQGLDEASLAGQNTLVLLDKGDLIPFSLTAEDVGLRSAPLEAIRGGNADENAVIMKNLLAGEQSAYLDTVLINAGIGLFAHGQAETIKEGVAMAKDSIGSGRALQKLETVVAYSEQLKGVEVGQ